MRGVAGRIALYATCLLALAACAPNRALVRESAALAGSFLLRRNVRLVAEADWDVEADGWSASLGTVAAF